MATVTLVELADPIYGMQRMVRLSAPPLLQCTCLLLPSTSRASSSSAAALLRPSPSSSSSSAEPRKKSPSAVQWRMRNLPPLPRERPPKKAMDVWRSTSRPPPDPSKYRNIPKAGSLNEDKAWAIKREQDRLVSLNLDKRISDEVEKVYKSAYNVFPETREDWDEEAEERKRRKKKYHSGEPKAPAYHPNSTPFSASMAGGGAGGQRMTERERLVPGFYQRRDVPLRKKVEPVRRGGVVNRNEEKGPMKRMFKLRPKALRKVTLPSTIRLENLTRLLGVKLRLLQKTMVNVGLEDTRADRLLTAEDASLVALELNFDPIIDDEAAFDVYPLPPSSDPDLPLRPPVTGIFGHVDHGKTSLLDALRSTSVAAGEAGGITQHIGAFEVSVESIVQNLRARSGKAAKAATSSTVEQGTTITFLDTPGHAAFTAMRQRGAGVTDVVVLVVAADDGVKPQTEEVIKLIKSSDVTVVVALTKVDKPGVDTYKVKQSLMAAGVEVEEFGGDVPCVEVSSLTGQGLPDLLETISAIAEVRELKAERVGRVEGRVLESRVEKGRGNVATVLVLRGCLEPASALVAGTTWCRVRSLTPPTGTPIKEVYPGQPVEVTGWKDLPTAGDLVLEASSEDEAKKAVANRLRRIEQDKIWEDVEIINEKARIEAEVEEVRKGEEANARAKGLRVGEVAAAGEKAVQGMEKSEAEGVKELVLIVKADVSGTVEAVVGALEGIGNKEAKVKIISSAVGEVTDSDVEMARAVEGHIIGFNVKASNSVLKAATRPPYAVPIHTSPIIYRLVETVREAVADLLPKDLETRVHGEATVQQIFEIKVKGKKEPKKVAGCKVGNGIFQKARKARVVRNGETLHTGAVSTLKQVKKDVLEIQKGVECGIALEDFDAFEPNDVIQSIEEIEVTRSL